MFKTIRNIALVLVVALIACCSPIVANQVADSMLDDEPLD